MKYADQVRIIRRFLRDPDGEIWTDAMILNTWNDSQYELFDEVGKIQNIVSVRIPSWFQNSYTYMWEQSYEFTPQFTQTYTFAWELTYADTTDETEQILTESPTGESVCFLWEQFIDTTEAPEYVCTVDWERWEYNRGYTNVTYYDREYGEKWQWGLYYDPEDYACCFRWETQCIEGYDSSESSLGYRGTHPWEAWQTNDSTDPAPVSLPENFENMIAVYWDKKPIEGMDKSAVQYNDWSWMYQTGEVQKYWRDDTLRNRLYLYPVPSSVDWSPANEVGEGDPDIAEYAGSSTYMEVENNLLCVYNRKPDEIQKNTDTFDYPSFFCKYVRCGVLERLYTMNSDGKIDSLRDYWGQRKKMAVEAMKMFNSKRTSAKRAMLRTKADPMMRTRKQPRLPDTFPAVW